MHANNNSFTGPLIIGSQSATFDYSKNQLMRWSFSNEDDGNKKGKKSNKSSIKPGGGGGLISNTFEGGGAYLRGRPI